MKGVIKFLLRTGAGEIIIGRVLELIIEFIRFKIRNRPRDHQDIINSTLTAIDKELREEIPKEIAKRL